MFKQEKLTKTTISKTRVIDSNLSSGMSKIEYKNFLRFFRRSASDEFQVFKTGYGL